MHGEIWLGNISILSERLPVSHCKSIEKLFFLFRQFYIWKGSFRKILISFWEPPGGNAIENDFSVFGAYCAFVLNIRFRRTESIFKGHHDHRIHTRSHTAAISRQTHTYWNRPTIYYQRDTRHFQANGTSLMALIVSLPSLLIRMIIVVRLFWLFFLFHSLWDSLLLFAGFKRKNEYIPYAAYVHYYRQLKLNS